MADIFKSIGLVSSKPDAQYHDVVQIYDAAHGKYASNVSDEKGDVGHLLPTVSMPMAGQHVPYVLKGGK